MCVIGPHVTSVTSTEGVLRFQQGLCGWSTQNSRCGLGVRFSAKHCDDLWAELYIQDGS